MKKVAPSKKTRKSTVDIELLRHWKRVSTKGKLDWLSDALYFGKLKRFE